MKKAIAIIVLGLLWCNTSFAGKLVYACYNPESDFQRVFEFDTNSWRYRDLKPTLAHLYSNIILSKVGFGEYSVDGGPLGYWVQARYFWLKPNSEGLNVFAFDTTDIDKKTFEVIISKLDEIDNGKFNKKLGSDGQFIYSVAPISNDEQYQNEMKKYSIVEPYAYGTVENNPNHFSVTMICKKRL